MKVSLILLLIVSSLVSSKRTKPNKSLKSNNIINSETKLSYKFENNDFNKEKCFIEIFSERERFYNKINMNTIIPNSYFEEVMNMLIELISKKKESIGCSEEIFFYLHENVDLKNSIINNILLKLGLNEQPKHMKIFFNKYSGKQQFTEYLNKTKQHSTESTNKVLTHYEDYQDVEDFYKAYFKNNESLTLNLRKFKPHKNLDK